MILPSAEEYVKIIEKKTPGSLAMLHHHRFALKGDGKTFHYEKGEHSIVFKTESRSRFYAVRFFLYDDRELIERYHHVQNYLSNKSLFWKVPFEFLDKEYYPAVQMDWIDSLSFAGYLDLIIADPSRIGQLQSNLINLSRSLEENGIGHGDLNLDHVRFVKQGQGYVLKLIDYDSMFIPSFSGKDSLTAGTASFQHPMRLASDFSETIDRFSFWVFLTALEAFKINSSLWTRASENGYDKSQQILFNFRDLAFPQQSRVFQLLKSYKNDALNFYTDKLIEFCNYKSLVGIEPPQLYGNNRIADRKKEMKQEIRVDPDLQKETKPQPAAPLPIASKPIIILPEQEPREEKKVFENEFVHLKVKSEPQRKAPSFPAKKNKRRKTIVFISLIVLVLLTSAYFVSKNRSARVPAKTVSTPKKTDPPLQQQPRSGSQETVFTSANITQFLFQLYQSYNKRDLHAILSNYSDSLSQYYDAGLTTKDKLNDIIKDLFIKPVFYECQPDLRTLQSNIQGDSCKLTVAINERIRPDRKSKTENYSSRIEYTVDRSFKILAEKNVE